MGGSLGLTVSVVVSDTRPKRLGSFMSLMICSWWRLVVTVKLRRV